MSEKKPEQKIMAIDADPAFDYGALQKIAMEADGITRTLDDLMGKMPTDCSDCGLQKICGEVKNMLKQIGDH